MLTTKVKRLALLGLLSFFLLLSGWGPSVRAAAAPEPVGKIRWAYYVAYDSTSLTSLREHISHLDYLSPWWFKLDNAGNLISDDPTVTDRNMEIVLQLARTNGIKVLPMVKNIPQYADFHPVLADQGLRRQAIQRIAAMAQDYDGVHIDFEGVDATDRPYLTAFMGELAAVMRPRGKLVTQALVAKDRELTSGWAGAFDYRALGEANDLLMLMAYGYSQARPIATAPFPWVEGSVAYAVSQIPAQKIILGVPWYGYDWQVGSGRPPTSLRYPQTMDLVRRYGVAPEYDETNKAVHFTYSASAEGHEVWYEDARSQDAKLDLVFQYGLAGAAGWRLGHEDPAVWNSFNARLSYRTWLLAEGSTAPPYHTWILIMNPNSTPANISVAFLKEDGQTVERSYRVAPTSRFSLFANQIVPDAAISTRVDSDQPIFVERAMYFGHDGHDSLGVNSPARRWYLPEGFTGPGVHTWVLLMNPNPAPTTARVTFMRDDGPPVVKEFSLRATSRLNVWANQHVPDAAFATLIEADLPIVAERAMYFDGGKGGHGSAGVTYTSRRWYFAEGATDGGFATWFLIMNPNSGPASATLTFMMEDGQKVSRSFTLSATSRLTVYANSIVGSRKFAALVEADRSVVVERAMYWAGGVSGHSTVGATAPATTWYLPEGSTAYPFQEWVLLMNPNASPAQVSATFMTETGAIVQRQYTLRPTSRLTISVDDIVPGTALSVRIDSDLPVVAERSMYFGTGGHNSMGLGR
ncbi:MAG: hypothetical protein HYU86_09565 [Chloroflexi bacterium]|nr:hypothetical protein [Chloroflexota bacterium]